MTTLRLVSWIVVIPVSVATVLMLILIGVAMIRCDCRTKAPCDRYLPMACDPPPPTKGTQWPT